MRGRQSPYTILGLRPGADRSAVEEAYRRLIKQHHPDIVSGDPERAAELNRAYAALKGAAPEAVPAFPVMEKRSARPVPKRGQVIGLLLAVTAVAVLLLVPAPTARVANEVRPQANQTQAAAGRGPDTLDLRSLPDEDAIATAVSAARRLHREGLDEEAARFSRNCEEDLRAYASPSLLDHCVAFDAATGLLEGRTPNARFRPEGMAPRHIRSALRVSNDPVLAEDRVVSVRQAAEKLLVRAEPR